MVELAVAMLKKLDAAQVQRIRVRIKRFVLFILVLSALVVLGRCLRHEMTIDRCLDRGGKWDERRQICEGAVE